MEQPGNEIAMPQPLGWSFQRTQSEVVPSLLLLLHHQRLKPGLPVSTALRNKPGPRNTWCVDLEDSPAHPSPFPILATPSSPSPDPTLTQPNPITPHTKRSRIPPHYSLSTRGKTLFCRAVTSILSQRLVHEMMDSRSVLIARLHHLAKKLNP